MINSGTMRKEQQTNLHSEDTFKNSQIKKEQINSNHLLKQTHVITKESLSQECKNISEDNSVHYHIITYHYHNKAKGEKFCQEFFDKLFDHYLIKFNTS